MEDTPLHHDAAGATHKEGPSMSRLRKMQAAGELSGSGSPIGSARSDSATSGPWAETSCTSPDERPAARPGTTDTVQTSRAGTADALKQKRADDLAAEIAVKEERLRLKKAKTVELRLAHFRKKFEQFDGDGSGAIDLDETHAAFADLGIQLDKYTVKKMFQKYDEDGSGTIDFNEFAELITSFNRERYTKVFKSFDIDGSGELDAEEVGQAFAQLGFEFSAEFVGSLISEFDYSGDGLIQLDEFVDMIESTLITQEEEAEAVVVSESPWGELWEMQAAVDGFLDEETNTWEWAISSTLRADPAESEAAADGSRCPLGWRPTAYLKSDGSKFRGTDSSIIVNQGWRQRGVPMRQILWNYNEADSWEVEFKDPKQPPSYVTTGNNEPILGEVKFRAPTLLGDARRTLRIPCASQSPLTLGEVVGELLDVADAEPELRDRSVGISAGQGDVGGGPDHLSLESSFRSGSSLEEDDSSRPPSGNGAVLADSSTGSLGFSGEPDGDLPPSAEIIGVFQEGEYRNESMLPSANPSVVLTDGTSPAQAACSPDVVEVPRRGQSHAGGEGEGVQRTTENSEAGVSRGDSEANVGDGTDILEVRSSTQRPEDEDFIPGGDALASPRFDDSVSKGLARPTKTAQPSSPIKINVDYGPDGKNSAKYNKFVETIKDLDLKRQFNGSLRLMEERQYALMVRQVEQMDAKAAQLDEEARAKAEEDALFKPRGTVTWVVRIEELDESAMGMRVGVVHRSVKAGEDWGDFSAANNKTWWWNSFSGNLFVGDVLVPESGNVNDMTTISQWAPSRNKPMMGVPWMKGDVLTVSLDLAEGEITFAKNGKPTPHRVRGVYGEVYFAVQMAAEGDRVVLLEPGADKNHRIDRLFKEEQERMEMAKAALEAKRKKAMAALGLV